MSGKNPLLGTVQGVPELKRELDQLVPSAANLAFETVLETELDTYHLDDEATTDKQCHQSNPRLRCASTSDDDSNKNDDEGTSGSDEEEEEEEEEEEADEEVLRDEVDLTNAAPMMDMLRVLFGDMDGGLETAGGPQASQEKDGKKSGRDVNVRKFLAPVSLRAFTKKKQRHTALHTASANSKPMASDVEILKLLVKRVEDVDVREDDGWTPLLFASQNGRVDIMQVLMEAGADVNCKAVDGRTPLMQAALNGENEACTVLLAGGALVNETSEIGKTALFSAIPQKHAQTVKLLIDAKANVRHLADLDVTPLHLAAAMGSSKEIVQMLLAAGADPRVKDWDLQTPLHRVCCMEISAQDLKTSAEIASLLIENNADLEARDSRSHTPLQYAAQNKSIHLLRVLLDNNADIETRDSNERTPLFNSYARPEHMRCLLERGADVFIADKDGAGPLFPVCTEGNVEGVKMLLDKKADVNVKCPYLGNLPETPLGIAVRKGFVEIVELLLDAGADPAM